MLLDDREQQVAHLEPRRAAVAILSFVHPPVGKRECLTRGLRLVRDQREAVRTAHGAGVVRLAERGLELGQQHVELTRITGDERTELVATEAVRGSTILHGLLEPARELREQPVALEVAERVVVVLEAVQVEQHERSR